MNLISERDIIQFRTQGYFVTDVVFEAEPLNAMANEMDRVFEAGVGRPNRQATKTRFRLRGESVHTVSFIHVALSPRSSSNLPSISKHAGT